jgi:hypothetical protein
MPANSAGNNLPESPFSLLDLMFSKQQLQVFWDVMPYNLEELSLLPASGCFFFQS